MPTVGMAALREPSQEIGEIGHYWVPSRERNIHRNLFYLVRGHARYGVGTPNETARETAQQQVRRACEKAKKKAKQAILAGIEASVTSHGWPSPAAPAGLAAPPPSVLNPTVADGLAVAPAAALAAAP